MDTCLVIVLFLITALASSWAGLKVASRDVTVHERTNNLLTAMIVIFIIGLTAVAIWSIATQ